MSSRITEYLSRLEKEKGDMQYGKENSSTCFVGSCNGVCSEPGYGPESALS